MGGAAEDGAGAVIHQDEIGDVDRQFPAVVERVLAGQAGVEAELFGFLQCLLSGAALAGLGAEFGHVRALGFQLFRQRVVGGDADKACAHERIRAGGVDLDLAPIGAGEAELQATGFTDPVRLHELHLGRPVIQPVDGREQFFGEIGDFEEPLGQLAALDICAGAPAFAVDYLLIGEHGHIDGIPVDHGVLAVDETFIQEIYEKSLLLAVIFRVAGGEFAGPVQRPAHRLHLGLHVFDVLVGPVFRVSAGGHRRVFGGHAEGVPAHRVQHVMAGREFVAGDYVAHRVVAHMAHVNAARRVREHLEHVVFGLVGAAGGAENTGLFPCGLPFGFDLVGGVTGHSFFLAQSGSGLAPDSGAARRRFRPFGAGNL